MDVKEVPQQITVKIPFSAEGNENFTTSVLVTWNVRQLKEHLERSLPNKPNPSAQKLILSGRVLSDEFILKDCFKTVQKGCSPILHLVCGRSAAESPDPVSFEGFRRRNVGIGVIPQPGVNTVPLTEEPPSVIPSHVSEQQVAMFQMYQNYYMYMMSMSGLQPTAMPFAPIAGMSPYQPIFPQMYNPASPFTPPQIQEQPAHHRPVIAIMRGQGVPNLVAGDPPPHHNAQIPDDDQRHRDILDWAYIGMRLVLFICIIYLYSSTSRFFSAFTMLTLFLLFNTIRDFRRWRERHARRQAGAQAAGVQGEQDNVPVDAASPPAAGAVPPREEAQLGLISTVVNIVIGFVTSLVPENVIHAVAN